MTIPTPEYKLEANFFMRRAEAVAADLVGRYLIVQRRDVDPIAAQLTSIAAYEGSEKSTAPTMNYAPGMIGISVKRGHRLIDIACGNKRNPACITLRGGIVYRPTGEPEVVKGPGNLSKALGFDDHMDSTPVFSDLVWFAGQALPDYLASRLKDPKNTTANHTGTFVLAPHSIEELLSSYVKSRP